MVASAALSMHTAEPIHDRRQTGRVGLRVAHRHRIGATLSERVSELVYIRGHPVALLEWIDLGGVRTPLFICDLDPAQLRADLEDRGLFRYDGVTIDPRFPAAD